MPITDLLERNSKLYGDEIALVEINPEVQEEQRVTWKEYSLIQPTSTAPYRREITWSVFDEKANRVANMLLSRGIRKGQKVAILLMNCLEWLPIYFGILKAGAVAVPLNFRYTSDEIDYCLKLADADVLFFGPEFIGRMEAIAPKLSKQMLLLFVGETCPSFAEDYHRATANCSSVAPKILIDDEDEAAIYYSSGTTGFPKAILLKHRALLQSARMEAIHHDTTHDDVFLCIPPLYHTGAKMHWFGSLFTGSKAVLLKGNSPKAILQAVSPEHCTIVWLLVPWAQDILAALDRGYQEAARDPEGAVLAVKDGLPAVSEAMLVRSQRHLAPLLLDQRGHWGAIRPERWERMANWLVANGYYDRRRPTEYTNDFLPV